MPLRGVNFARRSGVSIESRLTVEIGSNILELAKHLRDVGLPRIVKVAQGGVGSSGTAAGTSARDGKLRIETERHFSSCLTRLGVTPGLTEELIKEGGFGRALTQVGAQRPALKTLVQNRLFWRVPERYVVEVPLRAEISS